jgi:hypothetical protein
LDQILSVDGICRPGMESCAVWNVIFGELFIFLVQNVRTPH